MHKNQRSPRNVLSHFLKSRRARLRPEDVGLPISRRRRLSGLRREEVAALAGVGTTWYGLFEAGSHIHVSVGLIDSVGAALRLTNEELRYLHSLVVADNEASFDYERDEPNDCVRRALSEMSAVPAFVIGPRLDYLAINEIARKLYRITLSAPPETLNLALRLFLDPAAPSLYPNWSSSASRAVSKLRRNHGARIGNESFERLIARLTSESRAFQTAWELHEISPSREPVSETPGLPDGTQYHYRLQTFDIPDTREQSLVLLLPIAEADAALLKNHDGLQAH